MYDFDTFSVTQNQHSFRAISHTYKITLGPQTSYYEENDNDSIPLTKYTFMSIPDILAVLEDKEIGYLRGIFLVYVPPFLMFVSFDYV